MTQRVNSTPLQRLRAFNWAGQQAFDVMPQDLAGFVAKQIDRFETHAQSKVANDAGQPVVGIWAGVAKGVHLGRKLAVVPLFADTIVRLSRGLVGAAGGAIGALIGGDKGRNWGQAIGFTCTLPLCPLSTYPQLAASAVGLSAAVIGALVGAVVGAAAGVLSAGTRALTEESTWGFLLANTA